MGYGNLVKGMCKNPTGINLLTIIISWLVKRIPKQTSSLIIPKHMQDDKPPI